MKKIIIDGVAGTWVPDTIESVIPEGYVSPHFRIAEFNCNHCGKGGDLISRELLEVLEDVRAHFGGKPVTVNSGVRCDFHNKAVGGANNSRHKMENADAADIVVQDVAPATVHAYVIGKYPTKYGIGHYASFTHLDVRPSGPARW